MIFNGSDHKIHFIGIGGSAIAPLAIMLKQQGYRITGSDNNVFEPALSLLNKNGIQWYQGFKPEMIKDVDLVIIGGSMLMKDSGNPEYVEAKKLKKKMESFTYLVREHIVKKNSIVVCGTYGKTTITSLIAWILETAGMNPSFLIGGIPLNFDTGIRKTDTEYSVVEGDEYAASFGFDMAPKFLYYKPKYTIITSAQWDHVNLYKTEESYIGAYKKLVSAVKKNKGTLFLSRKGHNIEKVTEGYEGRKIYYGEKNAGFHIKKVSFEKDKTIFNVEKENETIGEFQTQLMGEHNVENCLAAISLTYELGIKTCYIAEALETYKGVKRRLEILGQNSKGATVIDDFAHSPIKAEATLEALRTRYKKNKVIVIYTPRASERDSKKTLKWYKESFKNADHIIIPKIMVKKSSGKDDRIHGIDIVDAINKPEKSKHYFPKEEQILKFLDKHSSKNTIIIFMSAGGWGELMEKALKI